MGRLFQAQMAAIQRGRRRGAGHDQPAGVGFKGFVPAVFGRMVNERFKEKVGDEAQIKVTAPVELVRNRGARPGRLGDARISRTELLDPGWPQGPGLRRRRPNRTAARRFASWCRSITVPAASPAMASLKGEIDITGYPMEGGKLDDLGGVISITLFR